MEKGDKFAGVPEGSDDFLAKKAQKFLIRAKKIPEDKGITLRVTKKQGRYYVTEWRTGEQTFAYHTKGVTDKPQDMPIARIAPVPGKKGLWQLAWMPKDMRWHNLDEEYQGSFEECLQLIVDDPDYCFWG